jgi:hypothetical protein
MMNPFDSMILGKSHRAIFKKIRCPNFQREYTPAGVV